MIIKLGLLQERVEYIVAQMGNKVKVGEPSNEGFVELEFEINDGWEALQIFHAGFECGYDYRKKNTASLV